MKEGFMHGGQEGTLPLVLPYRELAYPVILNRTPQRRRSWTSVPLVRIQRLIKVSGQLFRSFNASIKSLWRFFHPLSLPPRNHGRWSADMPHRRRW